jgi:hypothetical protein
MALLCPKTTISCRSIHKLPSCALRGLSHEPVWHEKLKIFYGKFHIFTFQTKMPRLVPPQLRTALKAQSTDGTQVGPLACVFS